MTAPNTTNNVTVRKLVNVAEGMWNKSKNAFVNASGDTMTGRLTMENVPINQIVTGTGTAATSSSSGGTTTYYPAKWNFDLGIATPSAGDQLVIKIPVAGHDYGTFMSTDNGTTYFPVAQSTGATRFTTRYPVNAYVFIVFEEYTGSENSGQVNDCYAVAGSTGRSAYKVGCWRVVNDYDSGNNYDRLYNSAGRFRTGTTGCYPYSLVCLDNTQGYSTLVTSNPGTGTNKNVNTEGKFVFPASILYYAGNNTTAAGALVSSTYATFLAMPNVDVRYSSNHTTTFTTHKPVYIECTLNGDGTWSPTSNSITQTLRTGYYYIYLGIAYSTEYQVSLAPEHPLYYYDGTNLVSAEVARGDITAGTNNGELNVAGTDITVYTHPTDAGNKHIPAGGSSGQFLGWDSAGTAKWVSNPNTDIKVKATAKTDDANYKILATASASPTSGAATEAVYDTDITLNPLNNTISANVSGTAASAGKLTTARTTYVTLGTASTSTTRDWSGTTTIPVSGTLGLGNGGTGATSAAGARTNLDVYSKSETESLLNGKVVVVTQLPATGESGVTYYVKDTSSSAVDKYDEYIWAKDAGASTESWIHVGEKSIDLSNYVNALSTSGSGPLVTSLSKSGNTLTATMGTISIDDLSDWATDTDVTVSSVTYHTWWPVAPTSSNQVYGLSIYNGRLYRIYNNKGTYSAQAYDTNTTYTNKSLGQGYGTCATEAATAAKIVSMSDYALTTGGIVTVKFTNALCTSATMNINGKGAKPIYIKGAAVTANNAATVSAGDTAYFMYDGTAYHLLGTDRAATNPIVNISRSGTTFTATRLDGTTFTFTQQDNNTTYTQAKLGQGYGTCTTAEATAAKSVTLTGYELEPNGVVAVKFTNGLCASATMSINGKTATPIYINGAAVTSTSCKEVLAGDLAFFIYDGSHYQFICTDRISKNGITGLSISGKTITYTRADGSTGTLTTQDTTYTFDGVYNSSSNKAATVSTVTNAVNALDVDDITGFGAGKTLKTLTETDGKIAATFQDISITKSQVSDFSHAHGNITNDGKIGSTANLPVITGTSGSVTTGSFATSTVSVDTSSSAGTANTFSRGDHKHSISLATGDAPGQVKIAGTNVDVKGWDNKQSYYDATFTRSYKNVSNCWAKLASMSLDLSTTSEVSGAWEIFASGQWAQVGIVNFHTKITANATTSSYSENALYWIGDTAAINSGYNFCMVLKPKAASGQPVVMELWGECTTRYQGIGIREIGGTGSSAERDPAHTWVYYNPTDSDIGAKPAATEGTVIVDPIPHTQTKSVLKSFTIPAGQVSYVKIMTPTGQHQKMVVYSADGTNLHGECILRTYNDGSPSSGRCQVLALGGNPRRWFGKANEQYIEFDWTAESDNRAFRFGITELSGGDSVNFELVDTLPSGTTEITPTRITPASHTHGNIQNGGALQTSDVTIASGDKLVVTDSSDSNKVARASVSFDGSTTTKALTQKGTFESFVGSIKKNGSAITPSSGVADIGYMPVTEEQATATVQEVIQALRVKPGGRMGSVLLNASTVSSTSIPAAWYNYIWIPHRTGAAVGDIQNFGTLILTPLTSTPDVYVIEGSNLHTSSPTYRIKRLDAVTAEAAIATGDKLLFSDASDGSKTKSMNDGFDTAVSDTFICRNGNFATVKEADVRWGGSFRRELSPIEFGNMCRNVIHNPPPAAIKFEKTTDGGTTWTEQTVTDNAKMQLCNLTLGSNFSILNSEYSGVSSTNMLKARITLTAMENFAVTSYSNTWFYAQCKRIVVYCSRSGNSQLKIETQSGSNFIAHNDTWTDRGTYAIAGNSGWNSIPFDMDVGGYSGQLSDSLVAIRFTYWIESGSTPRITISRIGIIPQIHWTSRAGNIPFLGVPIGIENNGDGTIAKASKLSNARELSVDLSSTSTTATSFDGTANVSIKNTGTLPVSKGGTGKTSVTAAEYNILSKARTELTAPPEDNYRFLFGTTSPSESAGIIDGYRTASNIWSWIKGKLTSVSGVNISGNAATATKATQDSDGNVISTTYLKELYQAEYGVSTFADIYAAVTAKKTVYCKVPGGDASNGARMAFLAYINVSNPPTSSSNIEFQYYRSNSSGTGDSVFIYTITNNNNTWTTVERAADTNVKATAKTTDNVNYKILATASASPTSGAVTEAVYDPDITLNPSTNTIAANVSGNAATASAAKSGSALETAINAKQDALATQTAYTAKGSATKVPQITTNALGQVTNIEEIDIGYSNSTDLVVDNENNSTPFLLYEISNVGLTQSYTTAVTELMVYLVRSSAVAPESATANHMSFKVSIHWQWSLVRTNVEGSLPFGTVTAVLVNSATPTAGSDVSTLKIYLTPKNYVSYRVVVTDNRIRGNGDLVRGTITKRGVREAIPTASDLVIVGTTNVMTMQTKENLITSWNSTPSDTVYPSEKLVKTSINAKQDALTFDNSRPLTIGTTAAANTATGNGHFHDGIASVARASVTNIDLPNGGVDRARLTLSQVTSQTTQGIDPGDGYVLNLLWDNTSNWDTQIYVPNAKNADKDFGHLKIRYKNESSTWGDWEYLPGAFMGALLDANSDLDSLYQGIPGEVIQYYWKYTSKPICTSGLNKPGMIANNGLPTGTGSANLYAFHQSSTRTSEGIIVQVMICEDVGIYYRHRRGSSTGENWSQWTKVLLASDITTDTSTKNGKITIAGNDLTVYVHPAGSAASKTGVPTANATPAFGGTFKVNQITTDATSHVSAVTERTITIPNTTGNASTAGLTKLYTATGTNTDGTMTQNAIKSALDAKMSSTVSEDASNELQVVGVQSSATSTLKRDSGVTVQGGAVKATTFKLGTNATITYNSTTEAIDFTFL